MSRSRPFIIDDATKEDVLFPAGKARGLEPGSGYGTRAGYAGVAEPFPDSLLIPRSEWQARIQEIEERQLGLTSRCVRAGLDVKDQARTNYCWINSPTNCLEMLRVSQNQAPVILSPASGGAQIKNYRNVGGWGREALEWIVEHGLVPVDRWPANAIDRRYATAENKELARKYRVDEWWVLDSRDIDQVVSCLLRGHPVSGGFNWWGHQVTLSEAKWIDGDIAIEIWNSWGQSWGEDGLGVLQGNRMLPDDGCSPRTAIPS